MDLGHNLNDQSVLFSVNKTLLLCVCVYVKDDVVGRV